MRGRGLRATIGPPIAPIIVGVATVVGRVWGGGTCVAVPRLGMIGISKVRSVVVLWAWQRREIGRMTKGGGAKKKK